MRNKKIPSNYGFKWYEIFFEFAVSGRESGEAGIMMKKYCAGTLKPKVNQIIIKLLFFHVFSFIFISSDSWLRTEQTQFRELPHVLVLDLRLYISLSCGTASAIVVPLLIRLRTIRFTHYLCVSLPSLNRMELSWVEIRTRSCLAGYHYQWIFR